MKTSWVVIVSACLGVVAGVSTSWGRIGWRITPEPASTSVGHDAGTDEPARTDHREPKVLVDVNEFNFGNVAYDETVEHAFVFRNVGEAPLTLDSGGTSCNKCTVSKLPADPIPPGQSAEVWVNYRAVTDADFRQTATILTNDPRNSRIELTVSGIVVVPARVTPHEVVFSRMLANEPQTATFTVVGLLTDDFIIKSWEFVDPESAAAFEAAIQPMSAADIEAAKAKSGYNVTISVKPGLPIGPVRQNLMLHTNLPEMPEMVIPIAGRVDGEISISGGNYDSSSGILNLGTIERDQGAERRLLLLVRGMHRHEVHVKVATCDPPLIEATLGEPSDLKTGAVVQIPLVVKIPPGSPPANHLIHFGKVLLETDHPQSKNLRIWVQFAVEE